MDKRFIEYLNRRSKSELTIKSRLSDVRMFLRTYEPFTTESIQKYIDKQALTKDSKTIARYIASLKQYGVAIEKSIGEIIHSRVTRNIPEIIDNDDYFKMKDYISGLKPDSVDNLNRRVVFVLLSLTLRRMDIMNLSVDDIDIGGRTLKFITKRGKQVIKPIGYGFEYIKEYLDWRKKQQVATNKFVIVENDGYFSELKISDVYDIVDKISINGCGKKHNPHKFRHTIATGYWVKTGDIRFVQELLGHEDIQTTQIYTHVPTDHFKDFAQKNHPLN